MSKSFYIETHGCQMNVYDSEFICGLLLREGYTVAEDAAAAALVLVNTCSVRARAERKAISRLRELAALRKGSPDKIIGIVGCMAQRLGERLREEGAQVDLVLGPDTYVSIPKILDRLEREGGPLVDVSQDPARLYSLRPEAHDSVTAFVTIMRGCNNFCSFCVVPYVRGRERSKPHGEILREIRHMVNLGVKEVTLLGQNVDSYQDEGVDFAALLTLANTIDGLERIRFTTSHPKDLTPGVLESMRDLPKVCEHLHLPLQSGSDRILELMNRSYTYEQYRRLVDNGRSTVPGLVVTTDLMVGFPSETAADHETTLKAVKDIEFEAAFMFKYSTRPGTRASKLRDDVPEMEKTRRLEQVIELQNRITDEKKHRLIGQDVEILVEGHSRKDPGYLTGRTRKNWLAKLPGKGVRKGEVVTARVTGVTRWMVTCDQALRKVGA